MIQNIIDDLKNQGIQPDLVQFELIKSLVENYSPKKKLFSIFGKTTKSNSFNNGFYVWGDVGRGKTMLLKTFIQNIEKRKGVFHYIDLMQDIHDQLSALSGKKNPLNIITTSYVKKYDVIFIDEFQVEDVADAMIIGNLVNHLIQEGVQMFITSNAHPNDLYKNGLQRQKFIESMSIIEKSLKVYELKGLIDYRTRNIYKFDHSNNKEIYKDKDILGLIKVNFDNDISIDESFKVNSRKFNCKGASKEFLWISHKEFFRQPTGSKDFIEICKNYDWIFLNEFIECDDNQADIVRRFISFIDICYREKMKIKFFFNETQIDNLYQGNRLQILWDRCLSRLNEMQTIEYLESN